MSRWLVVGAMLVAFQARATGLGGEVECTLCRLNGCCTTETTTLSSTTTTTTVPPPACGEPPDYVCSPTRWLGRHVLRCTPVAPEP